jgi:hypothetical protein
MRLVSVLFISVPLRKRISVASNRSIVVQLELIKQRVINHLVPAAGGLISRYRT